MGVAILNLAKCQNFTCSVKFNGLCRRMKRKKKKELDASNQFWSFFFSRRRRRRNIKIYGASFTFIEGTSCWWKIDSLSRRDLIIDEYVSRLEKKCRLMLHSVEIWQIKVANIFWSWSDFWLLRTFFSHEKLHNIRDRKIITFPHCGWSKLISIQP